MFGTPLRRFVRDTADDSPELRRDRVRNNQKLKSRFERIFERYGKDFDGVGDEIDLETGRLVVDNGHISRMQHERDTGSTPSRRFVRAFTQELGGEDHLESRALDHLRSQGRYDRTPHSSSARSSHHRQSGERAEATPPDSRIRSANAPDVRSSPVAALSTSALIPMMQNSLTSSTLDADAVNSLGNALATQIASFLNQQLLSQLSAPRQDPWAAPPLPESRLPRVHHASNSASYTPGLRSPTPLGMSLWGAREDRHRHHDGRHHHRHRYADSVDRYDSDAPLPSVEYYPTHDYEYTTAEAGDVDPAPHSKFTSFLRDAECSFHTLAHGFANRATMTDKEVRRAFKHATADLPGAGILTAAKPYTLEEDRIIIKLKKRNFNSAQIARYLPGRTEASIAVRYSRALKPGSERFDQKRIIELADDDDTQPVVPLSLPTEQLTEGEQPTETDIDAAEAPLTTDMTPSLQVIGNLQAARRVRSPPMIEAAVTHGKEPKTALHAPTDRIECRSDTNALPSKKRKRVISEKFQFTNLSAEQFTHPQARKKRGRPRKHPRDDDLISVRSTLSEEPTRRHQTIERDVSEPGGQEDGEVVGTPSPSRETDVSHRLEISLDGMVDVQPIEVDETVRHDPPPPSRNRPSDARLDSVAPVRGDGNTPERQPLPYYHDVSGHPAGSYSNLRSSPSLQESPSYVDHSNLHYSRGANNMNSPFDMPLANSPTTSGRPMSAGSETDALIPLDPRLLLSSPKKPEKHVSEAKVATSIEMQGDFPGQQTRTPESEQSRKSLSSTPRLVNGRKASITPINRTLLSPSRRRTGSDQRSARSASFQPRYSSPLRQAKPTAAKQRPLIIDDSEDDL